jgi:hypothetical protein
MFTSRMSGTRSKPRLVWLWMMSVAGVSAGITRYVCSPGPNGRSWRRCKPAVVTIVARQAASGFVSRTNGAVSFACIGRFNRFFRLASGNRSRRGLIASGTDRAPELLGEGGAVDEERVAENPARVVGCEKERRARDVGRGADPAERDVLEERFANVRPFLLKGGERRVDQAGPIPTTRMPRGPSSSAATRVSISTPALAAQ